MEKFIRHVKEMGYECIPSIECSYDAILSRSERLIVVNPTITKSKINEVYSYLFKEVF